MLFKTNVGTLLLFYNRRIDIVQNQPRNVYLMNQINVRELFRKDNQDLTDDFIDVFKDIFQQQFDLIIQTCYIYYYTNDHGTDVFDQVFYFTNERMVAVVYTKGTIAGGNFDVPANYTATMGIQLNNIPFRSFDGYNSRNDYSTHFGAGVVDLAARWRPPFGMFVTLTLDNQKIFYRFIGNLLWYFCKLSIAEDVLARRPLFINVWGTLLYKKDLDIANLYNYDNTLYWLNQCLEKKIFYYNVISNDSSKYLTSSRAASFHVCIPYKFCRFEMTSNLLTDFYPFVNFFSKIIDKPEVIQKLSDFGRNLLSRFLKSVSQENTNVFIPNLFKRK